jgi:hypothetical protein
MTEPPRSGLHFHISKLLVAVFILAIAATGALIIIVLVLMPSASIPPPGPGGMPPPPPNMQPLAVFPIVTGFFVLSWLAVLVVFSRDQVLQLLHQPPAGGVSREELDRLRAEIAADRERDLAALSEQLVEYGERRETDGYLNGMRTAASEPPEANVRSIRRPPSPR